MIYLNEDYHRSKILKINEKLDNIVDSFLLYKNYVCENYSKNNKILLEVAFLPLLLRSLAANKLDSLMDEYGEKDVSDAIDTVKNNAKEWLKDNLNLSDDFMGIIDAKLDDLENEDLPKVYSDPEFLTNLIFSDIADYGSRLLKSDDSNPFVNSVIASFLDDAKSDDAMAEKMKAVLYDFIESKMGTVLDNIKGRIFGN